jgi:3',5'-cyclic AMP phosphodiesterase CpdA
MNVIHISDLHVSSPNYKKVWGDKVVGFVNSKEPDLLLISGDLTNDGHLHEYEMWRDFFSRFNVSDCVIVPGNHDAMNDGWELFEEMVGPRHPVWSNDQVVVQGIDSSEPDIDDGNVGRHNYPVIRETMASAGGRVKMMMLHHHLIPIPGTGRERQIPTDAGDVLGVVRECGIHVVLSGHRHKNWIWNLDGTYFITCGTSTSRRLKGRGHPSLMIYELDGTHFVASELNVRDDVIQTKLDANLGE